MASPRRLIPTLWLLLVAGLVPVLSAPEQPTIALTGALIRTQTEAGSFVGTLIIRDGKITALGPAVQVPADCKKLDAAGCVITPGLIDARSRLWLQPSAANEGGREASLSILDAVDPFAEDWRDAARQGVTAVYVQPAASGMLGGSGAVLRVGPSDTAEGLALLTPAAVQATLGQSPQAAPATAPTAPEPFGRRGPPQILPTQPTAPAPASTTLTRYAQYEQLRGQFDAAKRYADSKPTRPELPKELLVKTTKREVPVRIEVHHEDDIRNALRLATDYGIRPILERIDRVATLPEELGKSRAELVLGPFIGGRSSAEVRKLAMSNRRFAIGTFGDDARETIGLRLHAAAALSAGYSRDRVLAALTSDAADLLGVGDRLGRLAVGRSADFVVFAGDPLDPSVPVRLTISQGRITYEASAPITIAKAESNGGAALPAKLPDSFVIRTSRLLNGSGEFSPGELQVMGGRLSARTTSGSPLPLIDVGDAPVTPGLVTAHLGVAGESAPDADASHLRASDILGVDDARLRGGRDAGFLTAIIAPGSENVLAGITSAVRAGEATDVGLKFSLTSASRNRERYPVSLAGQLELISGRLRGDVVETNLHLPPAVRASLFAQRDQTLEAVRQQKLAACFEAQTPAEIRAALRLIQEYKLRGVLLLPRDVSEVVDEIRQAGVAVVVGPVRPRDNERVTHGVLALGKAGVPLAFAGEPAEARTSASWLANLGLSRAAARRALIAQPGEAHGLPASGSRLQPGDPADFVVWTGDPLDTISRPQAVVLNGNRLSASAAEAGPTSTGNRPAAGPTRPRTRGRN
jgi:imidazolonepropionase-like amidohydrolase